MNYPKYISRDGSKCYFEYDLETFDNDTDKCLELIAFYTLYMFGHSESTDDKLLILSKTDFREKDLQTCFKLMIKNKLNHKVFHLPDKQDKLLMNTYKGKAFVTDSLIDREDIPLLHTKRKSKHTYACMKDNYDVNVYTGRHVIYAGSDSDSEPDVDSDSYDFVLGKRVSQWDTSVEPGCGEDTSCIVCGCRELIDKTNFTIAKKDKSKKDTLNKRFYGSYKDNVERYNDGEYDEIFDTDRKDNVTLNNLIFNFKDYNFDINIKKNTAKITFDEKAIGGYRHASISTGAVFEVHHAVPSTLKYKSTSYVNKIYVEWNKFKRDNKYVICSEYKAIDVL